MVMPIEHLTDQEIIFQQDVKFELDITEQTYIFNVHGYGCPVPGISIPVYKVRDLKLRHNSLFGAELGGIAMGFKSPNFAFCEISYNGESVFGPEFKVGNTLQVTGTVVRAIQTHQVSSKESITLVESITLNVGKVAVRSSDHVSLN